MGCTLQTFCVSNAYVRCSYYFIMIGNMWAQQWSNIYPLVEPYPDAESVDITARMKALVGILKTLLGNIHLTLKGGGGLWFFSE